MPTVMDVWSFRIKIRLTTLCKRGWVAVRPWGAILLEHPVPASLLTQDSYVSKGGPLGGLGLRDCQTTPVQILGGRLNKHRENKSVNPPLDVLEQ
ncbi:MAG: hypothetical protein CL877_00570 [Dehalococcoidales bacterium]|jgi:hypothetical protein|nr:hypothetical protein [Dehalococcoidales bacterium]